ncbi:endoribonuclease RusA [Roseobacter phage RD-1410Ws-07]|uniref:Endoribonuclease RusA n=2 Tax=Sanyabayvirus DS1410Ws06 TaxID=2844087 RepID=A0A191VYS9_9CAUD|nr:RusA-like Holliday junction resolvase [Dinoroseobacter phage DS-1410Ws-06]ANJ20712.1 endoribonuclease RusA [Dinoroseobacter phage DS-1410Ws-06]ANJ20863.1 endoribonuclease RusA [Roseobacter phage RD-1410Ws-07]
MNVGSIVDKYFSDTLVNQGKLPDDNYDHIILSSFSFGGVCRMDGHAIATVNILTKEKTDMRILLDESDIQNALNAYVKTLQLPNAEQAEVEITVTDDGEIEAEVIMGEAKPKNKGGRPRGSKTRKPTPKKEEVTADVEETASGSDEGDSTDSDSGGSAAPETTADEGEKESPKAGGKGNLFGDSDGEASSDSPTTTEDEAKEEDGGQKKTVVKKKSSIFDVD